MLDENPRSQGGGFSLPFQLRRCSTYPLMALRLRGLDPSEQVGDENTLRAVELPRVAFRVEPAVRRQRSGLGSVSTEPSSRPSARSACEGSPCSSPESATGGSGGKGVGWKARYPVGCRMYRPARFALAGRVICARRLLHSLGAAPCCRQPISWNTLAAMRKSGLRKGRRPCVTEPYLSEATLPARRRG